MMMDHRTEKLVIKVPLHISGIWKICWMHDELESGSIGTGIVIEPGAEATVRYLSSNSRTLVLNSTELKIKNFTIIERLSGKTDRGFKIDVITKARLGYGYGLSAALSIIYSTACYYPRNIRKALEAAHIAEIKCLTGFGDVIAEVYGGDIEIRIKPGSPYTGKVLKIPYKRPIKVLTVELAYREDTKRMLIDRFSKIQKYGEIFLREFMKELTLEKFLECSNKFSKEIGFIDSEVKEIFNKIEKRFYIGYFVKKNLLIIFPEKEYVLDLKDLLSRSGKFICKEFYTTSRGIELSVKQ